MRLPLFFLACPVLATEPSIKVPLKQSLKEAVETNIDTAHIMQGKKLEHIDNDSKSLVEMQIKLLESQKSLLNAFLEFDRRINSTLEEREQILKKQFEQIAFEKIQEKLQSNQNIQKPAPSMLLRVAIALIICGVVSGIAFFAT